MKGPRNYYIFYLNLPGLTHPMAPILRLFVIVRVKVNVVQDHNICCR